MMKRSIFTAAVFAGVLGLAACNGGDDELQEPGFETTDPYATDPGATTAPPAGMGMDTMGMDTTGMMGDTMRR